MKLIHWSLMDDYLYRDGLPLSRQSPIQVVTGPSKK